MNLSQLKVGTTLDIFVLGSSKSFRNIANVERNWTVHHYDSEMWC